MAVDSEIRGAFFLLVVGRLGQYVRPHSHPTARLVTEVDSVEVPVVAGLLVETYLAVQLASHGEATLVETFHLGLLSHLRVGVVFARLPVLEVTEYPVRLICPGQTEHLVGIGGEFRLDAFHPSIVIEGDVLVQEDEDVVQLIPVRYLHFLRYAITLFS